MGHYRITQIEDYEPLIGSGNVDRIREKAQKLKGLVEEKFVLRLDKLSSKRVARAEHPKK
jgi:hypothetical protein